MDYLDIDLSLTDEDLAVQQAAHKFAEQVMRPASKKLEQLTPEQQIADDSPLWDFLKKAYELGYHKVGFPEQLGGMGLTPLQQAIVQEEFGWGSTGLAIQLGAAASHALGGMLSMNPALLEEFTIPFCNCTDGSIRGGKRVVIVGGGAIGCETALFIANLGVLDGRSFAFLVCHEADDFHRLRGELHKSHRKITVLELAERIAGNVGVSTRWGLLKNLRVRGVGLRSGVRITGIEKDAVTIETGNGTESVPADTIIIAAGAKSVDDLSRDVKPVGTQVVTIGDAKEPRKIGEMGTMSLSTFTAHVPTSRTSQSWTSSSWRTGK